MGVLKLKLPCPEKVGGISADPEPDWSFEHLLTEVSALEAKINGSCKALSPFTKQRARDFSISKSNGRSCTRTFVMRITDDDMDCIDDEDEEVQDQSSVGGTRFNFDELYLSDSDDSGDESALEAQPYLMKKVDLGESSLFELSREHQFRVKEEFRNQMSASEKYLKAASEEYVSALARVEKYSKERRERERKLDNEYQRNVAEALYNHLDVVQRDLEFQSQIEERKIRNDAAYEDAKRKEKALQEEKVQKERARAEAEMQAKRAEEAKRAEDAKRAALEAQSKAAKDASEKEASETSKRRDLGATREETHMPQVDTKSAGKIKAVENALKLEQGRLQKLEKLEEENRALRGFSNKDFRKHERQVAKLVGQITRAKDIVRRKAEELVNIFNDARCPQSISVETFAKKVVSHCTNEESDPFALSHVTVLVASKVPHAMDLVLAELHKACIYTVPKHYSKSAIESVEVYYKAIGFQEDEGKIETVEKYIYRLECYMKLYGAIVQTEISSVQNPHGLKEGWAWCARFLNPPLPANRYTAVALKAFLLMAGYSLYRKYGKQFAKILNCISDEFLKALRERGDSELNPAIAEIDAYIKDRKFLYEPKGKSMDGSFQSHVAVPEADYQQSNSYLQGGYSQGGHRY